MANKEQEAKEALNEDRKKFLENLQRQNGAGQGYINSLFEQSKTQKELENKAEITRIAAKITEDANIQTKVEELSAVIKTAFENATYTKQVAEYVKNANNYMFDKETGKYILIEVVKQASAQLGKKTLEDTKQKTEKANREENEK